MNSYHTSCFHSHDAPRSKSNINFQFDNSIAVLQNDPNLGTIPS